MFIRELARQTGISAKAIRFYESIGLLPRPARAANNYRQYTVEDVDRLRFIASTRSLGFSLEEVTEFLQARDAGRLPCRQVLDSVETQLEVIDRRIADLIALRATLLKVQRAGKDLPPDKACGPDCLCSPLALEHESTQRLSLKESANVGKLSANPNNSRPSLRPANRQRGRGLSV